MQGLNINLQELKSLIIKSADVANSLYASISKRLQGVYVAQSEFGTYTQATDLMLEANSKGVAQNYAHLQQIGGNLDSIQLDMQQTRDGMEDLLGEMTVLRSQISSTNAYIRSGMIAEDEQGLPVYGLEIGQTKQLNGEKIFDKFARFTADRLSFFDSNDVEVAYISDYHLHITNAVITGSLMLMQQFQVSQGNQSIDFKWLGG